MSALRPPGTLYLAAAFRRRAGGLGRGDFPASLGLGSVDFRPFLSVYLPTTCTQRGQPPPHFVRRRLPTPCTARGQLASHSFNGLNLPHPPAYRLTTRSASRAASGSPIAGAPCPTLTTRSASRAASGSLRSGGRPKLAGKSPRPNRPTRRRNAAARYSVPCGRKADNAHTQP